jgi:hypothetical protein
MTNNKYSPTVVCGFAAAVLTTIPELKTFGCCLLVPAASLVSLYIYLRLNRFQSPLLSIDAFKFGLLTGIFIAVFSTFFEILITYFTRTNEIISMLPQFELMLAKFNLGEAASQTVALLKLMAKEIQHSGFSVIFTFILFFNNLFSDIVFGIIGGFIGLSILNKKYFSNI